MGAVPSRGEGEWYLGVVVYVVMVRKGLAAVTTKVPLNFLTFCTKSSHTTVYTESTGLTIIAIILCADKIAVVRALSLGTRKLNVKSSYFWK